jgi:hypothetical protein
MKRHILTLSLAIAVLFVFNSCGKYEEGPGMSLRSKTARLTGVWKIEKQMVGGVEVTLDEETKNSTIEFMKDGKGKVSFSFMGLQMNMDLEWEFNSDKTKLKIRMKDFIDPTQWGEWSESEILRLTNKECWLKDTETDGGVTIETITHFAKQ